METLHTLKSTDPPLWLTPSASLSDSARKASQHLFSCLKPHVPKSPFDHLLVDEFDSEQIWQQIDILSQPLLSSLRRQVKHFENHPEEIGFVLEKKGNEVSQEAAEEKKGEELGEFDEYEMDLDEFDDEDGEEEEGGGKSGSEEDEDEEIGEEKEGIEDKFLKISELEEYLEEDEAREYGLENKKKKKNLDELDEEEDEEDEDGDEDEDEEEDDEVMPTFLFVFFYRFSVYCFVSCIVLFVRLPCFSDIDEIQALSVMVIQLNRTEINEKCEI